jgi:hypothetical protein
VLHFVVVVTVYAVGSLAVQEIFNRAVDAVAGIHPSGWLARELIDTIRLVYWRGLFDGFVAGFIVTTLATLRKHRP